MFIESGHWEKTQYLLEKGMDVEVTRRKVIADNIANADTPHFKRSEVTFEAGLRRALDSERSTQEESVPAKVTDSRHIPFFKALDYKQVQPAVRMDYLTTMRNDGNNIDIEAETQAMLKNQLRYQSMAQMISNNYRLLSSVMRMS